MVSVAEAESLVLSNLGRLPAEKCRLKNATGRVLRKAITADRDGPPFDRATLDGVCLRFSDWESGRREFKISGTQAAGDERVEAPAEGACLEIMTGAAVPAPCDCVLPVEDYTKEGETIRANEGAVIPSGQGLHRRASDFETGAELVLPVRRLTGREIAVAASCGCVEVDVSVEPSITIVTTGNELIEIDDEPKPHEIRRSNDLAMRASLFASGHTKINLTHLADEKQAISWALEPLLQSADVIISTACSPTSTRHLPPSSPTANS
jgi:molybdopterin molybdotransferase